MRSLKIRDFSEGEYCDYECNVDLWKDREIYCGIKLVNNDKKEKELKDYLFAINSKFLWIENNKKIIEDALISDKLLKLAEEWILKVDYYIEGEEMYEIDADAPLTIPLPEKDFRNSICIDSFGIDIVEDINTQKYDTILTMYLRCNPDYFNGHVIEIFIKNNDDIEVNGLAG